ncbi:hypothetical protein ACLB2K_047205 [Fragaria x ananassa]
MGHAIGPNPLRFGFMRLRGFLVRIGFDFMTQRFLVEVGFSKQLVSPPTSTISPGLSSPEVCSTIPLSSSNVPESSKVLPARSTRGQPPKKYEPLLSAKAKYPIVNYVSTHRLSKPYVAFVNQLSTPSKVQDAIKEEKWAKAIEVEMDAIKKNGTWDFVPLPPGKKTVGCRWVYTMKHNADGSVDKYKARLVAK